MAKYTKSEVWRLCIFWLFTSGIVFLVLSSILGIAGQQIGAIVTFVIGVLLVIPAAVMWGIIKVKQRNRKITNH